MQRIPTELRAADVVFLKEQRASSEDRLLVTQETTVATCVFPGTAAFRRTTCCTVAGRCSVHKGGSLALSKGKHSRCFWLAGRGELEARPCWHHTGSGGGQLRATADFPALLPSRPLTWFAAAISEKRGLCMQNRVSGSTPEGPGATEEAKFMDFWAEKSRRPDHQPQRQELGA